MHPLVLVLLSLLFTTITASFCQYGSGAAQFSKALLKINPPVFPFPALPFPTITFNYVRGSADHHQPAAVFWTTTGLPAAVVPIVLGVYGVPVPIPAPPIGLPAVGGPYAPGAAWRDALPATLLAAMQRYAPGPIAGRAVDDAYLQEVVEKMLLGPLARFLQSFDVPQPAVGLTFNRKEFYRLRIIDAFLTTALALGDPNVNPANRIPAASTNYRIQIEYEVPSWGVWNTFGVPTKEYLRGSVDYFIYSQFPDRWLGYIEAKALESCNELYLRQNYAQLLSLLGPELEDAATPLFTPLFAYGCLTNGEVWRFTRCWGMKIDNLGGFNRFQFGCSAEAPIDISAALSNYGVWFMGVNLEDILGAGGAGVAMNDVLIRLVHVFAGPR